MNTYTTHRHTTRDPVLDALYVRLYGAVRALCPRTARARIRDIAARRAHLYGEDADPVCRELIERIENHDTPCLP